MASNNANEPAFPETPLSGGKLGLTKREYFTGLAMQAVLSRTDTRATKDKASELHQAVAEFAIQIADALLAELEKTDAK